MQILAEADVEIFLFSHFSVIHREYIKLNAQKNSTCGPFSLSYILKGMGFKTHKEFQIDEGYIASLARVSISVDDARRSEEINQQIEEGSISEEEADKKYHSFWYRYKLRETTVPVELGTSCQGLIYACEQATEKKIAALPIPTSKNGIEYLTKERLVRLTKLLIDRRFQWSLQLILNYRTNNLLNMNHNDYSLFTLLEEENPADLMGCDPWSEGHFVSCGAIIRKRKKYYYLIRDTYSNKGFRGYHIQPFELLRKALLRDDGREGGLLLLVKREAEQAAQEQIKNIGLLLSPWDNGSPFYQD